MRAKQKAKEDRTVRVSFSARLNVALALLVEIDEDGHAQIIGVNVPSQGFSAVEVQEALDGDGELGALDKAAAEALAQIASRS